MPCLRGLLCTDFEKVLREYLSSFRSLLHDRGGVPPFPIARSQVKEPSLFTHPDEDTESVGYSSRRLVLGCVIRTRFAFSCCSIAALVVPATCFPLIGCDLTSVETRTENPRVGGSIPPLGTR